MLPDITAYINGTSWYLLKVDVLPSTSKERTVELCLSPSCAVEDNNTACMWTLYRSCWSCLVYR